MKRDIRTLFKEEDTSAKKLPENHREMFTQKLKKAKKNAPKKRPSGMFLKIAASIIILLSASYYLFTEKETTEKRPTTLELQVQQIEQEYLQQIDDEWQNFIKITNDKKLITKYREKLDNLDSNYKTLSKSFEESPNNITVLEKLIENLQTRLQLLKDIQAHINTLNTQQKTYETIIL